MPINARMQLSGDEATLAVLKSLSKSSRNRVFVPSMKDALKPVRDRVEELTPDQSKTVKEERAKRKKNKRKVRLRGQSPSVRMKKWIRIRAGKRTARFIIVRVVFPNRKILKIPPGAKWYYPSHVEYGTKDGKRRPVSMARKGFSETSSQAQTILQRKVEFYLGKEVIRLVRKQGSTTVKP